MPETQTKFQLFHAQDLPQLISLLNDTERHLRDFRPYTEEEFSLNWLQDETFDPQGLTLAWTNSRLDGASLAIVDQEYVRYQNQQRGFIKWIRVRDQAQSTTLRADLLSGSLNFLATHGMQEGLVSVPSHNEADLDFFGSNGFTTIRTFKYMEKPLPESSQENNLPAGYSWTHFKTGEESDYVDCINSSFKDHWGKRRTGVTEFTRWTQDPSFDSGGIIGIRKGSNLVGIIYSEIDAAYTEYTGRRRSMLWIIGVIPSEQGLGLGKAVTTAGINWSIEKGMKIAALFVDSENKRAVSLYRKLNFEPIYRVQHLLKRFR